MESRHEIGMLVRKNHNWLAVVSPYQQMPMLQFRDISNIGIFFIFLFDSTFNSKKAEQTNLGKYGRKVSNIFLTKKPIQRWYNNFSPPDITFFLPTFLSPAEYLHKQQMNIKVEALDDILFLCSSFNPASKMQIATEELSLNCLIESISSFNKSK